MNNIKTRAYFVSWIILNVPNVEIGNSVIYSDKLRSGEDLIQFIIEQTTRIKPGAVVLNFFEV